MKAKSEPGTPTETSEGWFRHLVEEIHDWVWEVDESLAFTYASPRVTELLGYTPEEVLGHTPFDFMAPAEAARVRALLIRTVERREPISLLENTLLAKDGREVVVETSGRPIFDAQGHFVGYRGVDRDITERKGAQEALQASEERYRTLFEAALDAVFVEDLEGNILDVNSRGLEMYGYSRAELVGASLSLVVPEEIARDLPRLRDKLLGTGQITLEAKGRRKSGEEFPTEVSIRLLSLAGRQVVIVYVRDITERKRAEQELRESEQRFRAVIEASPLAMAYMDLEDRVVIWNPATERMLGYTEEEVVGRTMPFRDEAERAAFTALLARAKAGETVTGVELTAHRKDGTPVQVSIYGTLIRDGAGRPLGVLGMAEDITERKRAEQALRESEQRLRAVIEYSPLGMTYLDLDNNVRMWNPAAERLLGYSEEELLGRPMPYHDDAQRAQLEDMIRRARAGETVTNEELTAYRKDGSRVELLISGTLIRDAAGRPTGVIGMAQDITERKRAEQALRESEERFRTVVQTSPLAIIAHDLEGRVQIWNHAAERIFGWTEEEVIGSPLPYLTPDQAEEAREIVSQVLAGGTLTGVERVRRRKDGSQVEVSLSLAALHNLAGEAVGIIGVVEDITERKRAEQALRESEERFRTLFQAAPLAVIYFAPDLRIRMWNHAAERMFGWTEEELVGRTLPYANPEEEAAFAQVIRRVLAGEQITGYEMRSYRKDGSPVEISVSASTLRDHEGRPIGFMGMAEDITARKLAEEDLARERAFLSTAVDIIPFPLGFVAPDGAVLRGNRAAQEQLARRGLSNWRQVVLLRPDTRNPIPWPQCPISSALQGELVTPQEVILTFPDGGELPILLTVAPILVEGQVAAAVWAFQDITALKQADREKDEFLAFLSHELLTPLTNIIGWAQAARQTPGMADQALEVIERNAHRQKLIVDDLLDVSRIVHGKLEIEPRPLELWRAVEESLEDFAPHLRQRNLHLVTHPPPEPMVVNADPRRLRQVMGNLLSNACKFTDSGGTITVSLTREGDAAVLSVQDTGRGIPPDQLRQLFAPFRQVRRRPEEGGLGLGLALVRGIVERHGGSVSAASPGEGQGTTITIRLPLPEQPVPVAGAPGG